MAEKEGGNCDVAMNGHDDQTENENGVSSEAYSLLLLSSVEATLRLAQIDPEVDLLEGVPHQRLTFSSPLGTDADFRLLELDHHLAERITQGDRLVFRGGAGDYPVLCTDERSYAVKEAETSNCLLLCPSLMLRETLLRLMIKCWSNRWYRCSLVFWSFVLYRNSTRTN